MKRSGSGGNLRTGGGEKRSPGNNTAGSWNEEFSSLADHLPVGVYRTSIEGRITYANSTLARMLGYDKADKLTGLEVGLLYVSRDERERQISTARDRSEVIQSEFQLRRKEGGIIWVRDHSRLIFDKTGMPDHFDGILEDITERMNAEAALKKREKMYSNLFEGANDAILILDEGLFADCNRMAVEMYGFERKRDLIGRSPWELSPPLQADGKPSEEKARSIIGKALEGIPQRFSWTHYRQGGENFVAEVSLSRFEQDTEIYIQAIVRDVTERRRAERKIRESEANLKAIIENSLESIWSVNTSYEIQYVNEVFASAFMETFGVQLGIGTNIIEALPEQLRDLWKSRYDRTFTNEHFVFEDRIDLGGNPVFIEVSMNPIMVDGKVTGASLYGRNVTQKRLAELELIRAKEKAEESDRLKSAFLANMSHEIRTPMNGILGFLELLRLPELSEENKSNYLDIVSRSGERLMDTINDIIEISKIEAREMSVFISEVRIRETMKYYHAFFLQQARLKGLNFRLSMRDDENNGIIRTDKVKLDGIVSNLLKNAIKFTPSGEIEFGNYPEGDQMVFFVRDTGIGIKPDRVGVIFDRFVQADLSNTRPHEGSGLGLSIVKAYIEMLGGRIEVESEYGRGSLFRFWVPVNSRREPSLE